MAERHSKIIVVSDDFSAKQVAEDTVASAVKSSNVVDSVSAMAGTDIPDPSSVLFEDTLNFVQAELTDAEAKRLEDKPGVLAVEDDEVVFAFGNGPGGVGPEGDADVDDLFDEDPEAEADLDSMQEEILEAYVDDTEYTAEDAAFAAQYEPKGFDNVDFDDEGRVFDLDVDEAVRAEAAGIPRDKLFELAKCVIKCAIDVFDGKVNEVSDDKISELLAQSGLPASSDAVAATRDYITCGLRIIYAPHAWRYSLGAGVRVAVVDTGIAMRHNDLRVRGGVSFVPGVGSWNDDQGHGTHVAGTIAALANGRGVIGVAPRASLYAVKVLDRAGRGRTSWILNGLAWCLRRRMHVVNLSLGSPATTHDPSNYSRAYEAAGGRLRRAGILPVAAAGNSGRTSRPFVGNPARCPSFMAVSAVDCARRRAAFSSYGPQVEICAPGVDVWSTYPPNGYRKLNGTSMACPHVAGVAALVKQRRPTWSGSAIRVHLMRTAIDLGSPGRDPLFGYGQVNAYRAVR